MIDELGITGPPDELRGDEPRPLDAKTRKRTLKACLAFAQLLGVGLVGWGLWMMWAPLAPAWAGVWLLLLVHSIWTDVKDDLK